MLKEEKKFHDSDLLEGMPSISALLKGIEAGINNRRILRILFDRDKLQSKKSELRFLQLKSQLMGFPVQLVSREEIEKITIGNTHGGIVAECTSRLLPRLETNSIIENGVYFILEGVEDPYNFGYAVRSLYASGVDGLILGERNWMGAAGVVARSSAGASELMNLYVDDPCHAADLFRAKGYTVICAGIRDSVSLYEVDLKKPLLVILGGEKRGISRNLLETANKIVRIDYGTSFGGSLSTAATAAVFGFEILRKNRGT